jgi:hypothetical protein
VAQLTSLGVVEDDVKIVFDLSDVVVPLVSFLFDEGRFGGGAAGRGR